MTGLATRSTPLKWDVRQRRTTQRDSVASDSAPEKAVDYFDRMLRATIRN